METHTEPKAEQSDNQDHLWCKCESEGSYFVPKGQDAKCRSRSCWRCNSCGLFVKIS